METLLLVLAFLISSLKGDSNSISSQISKLNPQTPMKDTRTEPSNHYPHHEYQNDGHEDESWFPNSHNTINYHSNSHSFHRQNHFSDDENHHSHASNTHSFSSHVPSESYSSSMEHGSILDDKLAVINPKNYFFAHPTDHQRDVKLIELAYPLLTSHHKHKKLNVLHVGTGSGFLPIALAILSENPNDQITSLAQNRSNLSRATENITTDGKEYFFRKLRILTTSSEYEHHDTNSLRIPKPHDGEKYDIIVMSKTVRSDAPFPMTLRDNLVSPGGFLIYPERDYSGHEKFRLDRLDWHGKLQSEKVLYAH